MRGINIVDHNDGLMATIVGEVEEEGDDSKDAEDMKDALGANPVSVDPTKDHSSTEVNASRLQYK